MAIHFHPPGRAPMRVLVITKAKTPVPLHALWEALGGLCDLERVAFGEAEMERHGEALARLDFSRYDRVLLDQNIRRIGRQYRALRAVPNLVFLEHDACQQFVPRSPWHRRYEIAFRDVGNLRVLVSNRTCELAFRAAGLDCGYLPKCHDQQRIQCLDGPRDIEFGYIGRMNHGVYTGRRTLLQAVREPLGLQMLRTEFGDAAGYNQLLNRIRFFVSADIGFNEYMFKNFEAMAAGCVLIAKRQPAIEQDALGFKDMEHLALYDDARELLEKAEMLRRDPALAERMARAGRALVESRHSMARRATELIELLRPPIRPAPPISLREKLRLLWIPGLRSP